MRENGRQAKILVVDDEVLIAADLQSRLGALGYSVCGTATRGEKALELVERHRPDLVLMDIVLKGEMDGIEAAEVIRDKWGVPVVFLTAYADADRLERAKMTYPFGYLLKPFQDRELKVAAEMALYAAKVDRERKAVEDRLRENLGFHRSLSLIRDSIEKSQTIEEMLENVIESALNIFDCDRAWLFFPCNPDVDTFDVNIEATKPEYPGAKSLGLHVPMTDDMAGYCTRALSNYGAALTDPPHGREMTNDIALKFGVRSMMFMSLKPVSGEPWMFGLHQCTFSRVWTETEKELFKEIGHRLNNALTSKAYSIQLEKSQKFLRKILAHSPLPAAWGDSDGSIISFNAELEELLGWGQSEIKDAKDWSEKIFSAQEHRDLFQKRLQQALNGQEQDRLVFSVIARDGENKDVEFDISPFEDGFLIRMTDRTNRAQAESRSDAAHATDTATQTTYVTSSVEAEKLFKTFMDNLPAYAFIKDQDGKYVFANEAFRELGGTDPSDRIGKTDFEIFPLEIAEEIVANDKLVLEELTSRQIIEQAWYKEKIQTHYVSKFPIPQSDGSCLLGGIALEITDWKAAEKELKINLEKYKALFELFPLGITISDSEGAIVESNETASKLLGLSREEHQDRTLGGDEWSIIRADGTPMPPDEFPSVRALKEKRLCEYHEMGIVKPDRSITWLTVTAAPIPLDNFGVLVAYDDVSELKKANDAVKSSLKEKEVLLKELHHRVKNNMQVIISLIRLQSDKFDDEQIKSSFLETLNRVYAMSAVHETLHQSKDISSVNLAEYLTKLAETTFQTYRTDRGGLRLSSEIQPITVDLSKSYPIGLVLNELLTNALKYAFPKGSAGEIKIKGWKKGENVSLVVSDTGVGFPENLDWEKADSLGLQLVRTLIPNQLRGTIELDRTGGTTWTITFPA